MPTVNRRAFMLALLASAAGVAALLRFPQLFRPAPFFPAAVVALITLLAWGVSPAILAQGTMLLATLVVLRMPGNRLADPEEPLGSRLALTVLLFVLADVLAWRLERKRRVTLLRERGFRESETRYRHVLEQASDGILLAAADGRLVLANQRICELLGYSEAELLELPLAALYADGEPEQTPPDWDELPPSSVVLRERLLRRKDGSTLLAELSVRRTSDGSAQAIVRDITERRRAEEVIRSEHALLESILATSVAGVMVVTPTGQVVFLNPAAEAALGIMRAQLADRTELPPGWRLLSLDGEPLPRSALPARRVMAAGDAVRDARLIVERPDGARRILSINAAPLRDGTGRITAVVLSLSDITEQQLAQQAIQESEQQLQHITSAVPGVVYQYVVGPGAECRFTFMSERAQDLFGVSAADILADPSCWWAMVDPEDHEAATRAFRPPVTMLEPRSLDFRIRGPADQLRWMRDIATALPARDPERLIWNGVIIDITDRKRLEEELLQSLKMDSLGRLAGGVAHDFNNLLTVIRGYADVLSGQLSGEDPRLAEVREIRRAADRATSLTRQLLAMSRRQVLVPREVDLNALVQDLERMLRRVIGEDIDIVVVAGAELGRVRADPSQLEQVLLNLAVNARDAMPNGGSLTISTIRVRVAPGHDESAAGGVAPGDYLVLGVADTGVGMDQETKRRIFEPFFTTKPAGEGTGLGLATVYGIVRQSGGAITVESEPGKGTRFRVFLPCVAERAAGADVSTSAGPVRSGRAPRSLILLVEDDQGVRQLTCRMLEQYGYEVVPAADGAEALQLLSRLHPGVDAVVSDVMMPGIGGTELIRQLRVSWPELPVLLLSGYQGEDVEGGVQPGSRQAFLQKPFSPDALAAALVELLADARPPATAE
ncbi:MAG TPA: PAS domain S-box protein [Gemmatimonadales bacterium]|nr:PAS domain S-box protein [Gemmatimonadales bacterium]